jgi:hypothetical protein
LQPRGQVRRLADHRLLLCGAFADQIAHDNEAGGDADPNLELPDAGRIKPSDRGSDLEAGTHGPLGNVFVGARIAEIDEYAVAHVFGDQTLEATNRLSRTLVTGGDHLAQLFRIEPRRQRRRADQVSEHHRQLPPFGRTRRRLGCSDGARRVRLSNGRRGQFGDGIADAQPMAGARYADVLQQLILDLWDQFGVDVVGVERVGILAETDRLQSISHRAHAANSSSSALASLRTRVPKPSVNQP